MNTLTDLADQAVLLPLAVVVAAFLAAGGWWRGALAWILGVGGTLATVGVGKLILAACGPIRLGDLLQSPSGHTAAASVVYGGLGGLVWYGAHPASGRGPPLALAAVVAGLIGATRIALGAHGWADVVVGGAVGCVGVLVLLKLAGPPPRSLRPVRLAAFAVIVVAAMHGTHLRAEGTIHDIGRRFAWLVPGCDVAAAQARP